MKIRRYFETSDTNVLEYTQEPWDGVVPAKVLYSESVTYSLYTPNKMWMEIGNQYSELYVVDEV